MKIRKAIASALLLLTVGLMTACSGDNTPPEITTATDTPVIVANAGPDQSVFLGTFVTLNGSKSTNANGTGLTYSWTMDKPAGSKATLSNPNIVNPTLTVDVEGTYEATLIVTDAQNTSLVSAPDTVMVISSKTNPPPVANAGKTSLNAFTGLPVLLDGSQSRDPNGDPLTFRWSIAGKPRGSSSTLRDPTTVAPTLIPDIDGRYIVNLVVSYGTSSSTPASVTINASPKPSPTADAGPDQIIPPNTQTVTLNGSGSHTNPQTNPPDLDYSWTINSSPSFSITLKNADKPSATFDIPAKTAGVVIAQLTVTDKSNPDTAGNTSSGTVMITVQPGTVTINVSPKNPPNVCSTVTLSGTSTSGTLNPYNWSLTRPTGSNSVLNSPDPATPAAKSAAPSFTADIQGIYTVRLGVVVNGVPGSDATITFTPEPNPAGKAIFTTDGLTPILACGNSGCHVASFFDPKSVSDITTAVTANPSKMSGPTTLSGQDLTAKIRDLKNYLDSTKATCP